MRQRLIACTLVTVALAVACASSHTTLVTTCSGGTIGCSCTASEGTGASEGTCDTAVVLGGTCCADPGWPSASTTCSCHGDTIFCGVVESYFTDGSSACVCGTSPHVDGKAGATCYPGGTMASATLGICCMFPTGECACGAGLHTCGGGGTAVTTCSAQNFATTIHACASPSRPVTSCSADGSAVVTDAGTVCACTSNTDCDPQYQFCQKTSCDVSSAGTCATRPGLRETFYCSPTDGGGPVCGCDGKTWAYACIANAQGINVATVGACVSDGGTSD